MRNLVVGWAIALQTCVLCSIAAAVAASSPSPAEYAIRWNPADGGPKTSAQAIAALEGESSDEDVYEVRYFDLERPHDAPKGSSAILRDRVKNAKKHELTFKYRGEKSLGTPKCPLAHPSETKNEIDVSVTAACEPKRVFAYSCTVESKDGPIEPPAKLQAKPKACSNTMRRRKIEALGAKVEEWRLPGDVVMLEVSRNGKDTKKDLAAFKADIADPLIAAGVKPSDRSKTELGSACGE